MKNGNYTVVHQGVGEPQPYAQLAKFYNIWKCDYGHIKVSRVAEDISEPCHQFAHCHNFMHHQSTLNSIADATLFTKDTIEDAEDANDPSNGDNVSKYEDDDNDNASTQQPTVKKAPLSNQPSRQQPSMQPWIREVEDDIKIIDENTRQHKEMIEMAPLHVKMAMVQRLVYVTLVHMARQHAHINLPHNICTYTFFVYHGQNMELPVFNKEQPGFSYYYSSLGVYNLGMVDQVHEDSNGHFVYHMHAHVYHEEVGKKGAKNVCSIIIKTLKKGHL